MHLFGEPWDGILFYIIVLFWLALAYKFFSLFYAPFKFYLYEDKIEIYFRKTKIEIIKFEDIKNLREPSLQDVPLFVTNFLGTYANSIISSKIVIETSKGKRMIDPKNINELREKFHEWKQSRPINQTSR